MWQGLAVDVPVGWKVCDGTFGTPDLRNKFLYGAGGAHNPDETGGSDGHTHTFTSDVHFHTFGGGMAIGSGANYSETTDSKVVSGTSDPTLHAPVFYSLVYIQYQG